MPKKAAGKAPAPKSRTDWLDKKTQTPLIDEYALQLGSFLDALADGRVEAKELKAQEKRLVELMKEVEPKLDDELHEQVTRLLCELSAYSVMQVLHDLQATRSKVKLNL